MANERVIFAHEVRPDQSFRVVATGLVDKAMVDAIAAFAAFQKSLLGADAQPAPASPTPSNDKPAG